MWAMRLCVAVVVVVVALASVPVAVRADLPVHCMRQDVVGSWTFVLSSLTNPPRTNCTAISPRELLRKDASTMSLKVDLQEPNVAVDENGNIGFWTMIYDQGFEVVVGGLKFFAFSAYEEVPLNKYVVDDDGNSVFKKTSVISHCGFISTGWVQQLDSASSFSSSSSSASEVFLQLLASQRSTPTPAVPSDLRDFDFGSASFAPTTSSPVHNGVLAWGCYVGMREGGDASPAQASLAADQPPVLGPSPSAAAPSSSPSLLQHQLYTPETALVDHVNTHDDIMWNATVYPHFLDKTLADFRALGGHRISRRTKPMKPTVPAPHPAHLPVNFDWRNVNGINFDNFPIRVQGSCGSCYAFSVMYMVQSRLQIAIYRKNGTLPQLPQLSAQEIVSCDFYAQGCEGGFPFLVVKHGQDFGFVEEQCFPYEERDLPCGAMACTEPRRYFGTNYRYVGAYYGGCNEQAMMQEIYDNGPIAVAFEVDGPFYHYASGIFHELPGVKMDNKGFIKTNHGVTAVGWGQDPVSGDKYWIAKNMWGATWGEGGYFRIRRGVDECGFETMASAIDVVV